MHAHATVITEHSLCLQLVLPRLYQLEQLIDKHRRDKEEKVIWYSYDTLHMSLD